MISTVFAAVFLLSGFFSPEPAFYKIITKEVTYTDVDGVSCKGFVAYPDIDDVKLPVMLVVPEWWGCTDFAKDRAKKMAELGYFAFAVDMYGKGEQVDKPEEAQKLAMPFYKDPNMALKRLKAAVDHCGKFQVANTEKLGGTGYCFGGSMLLNAAALGMKFKAIVSFHGGLNGVIAPTGKDNCARLICNGKSDSFVSPQDIKTFKSGLEASGNTYTFLEYAGATHAFTNPKATDTGKKYNLPIAYSAVADAASWQDMKDFLVKNFK